MASGPALAAGMAVIAVPNAHFPPDESVLGEASVVVRTLGEITVDLVRAADRIRTVSCTSLDPRAQLSGPALCLPHRHHQHRRRRVPGVSARRRGVRRGSRTPWPARGCHPVRRRSSRTGIA